MRAKNKFFSSFPAKNIKKGLIIYRPEDSISNIYYLVSGNVRQYVISKEGAEFNVHIYKPGSFFPIALVLGDIENRFYFEAANNIRVKVAPTDEVIKFLKANPKVLMNLTKRLSRGLNGILIRFEQDKSSKVEERLLSLLTYLSRNFPNEPTPTHQDLSSWLGVSRETVSRNIKKLKKQRGN